MLVFRKIWHALFSCNHVLKFALWLYYLQTIAFKSEVYLGDCQMSDNEDFLRK